MLVLVASCSKSSPQAPPPPPPVAADARSIDATALDAAAAFVPLISNQLVTAIVPEWSSTTAELRLWQREGDTWKLAMGPWPGVVGTAGVAWGIGLHGSGTPPGRSGPTKQEGDGKSPAGVFGFRSSYGYAKQAPATVLTYVSVDENWQCVDDPKSKRYTSIVDRRQGTPDWSSAEDMRRKDELYTWVVDIAHNPEASPGKGSCIFLHVWRGPSSATVGCTAMDERKLKTLIERLEPSATFVLLPRAEYDALAPVWDLPK